MLEQKVNDLFQYCARTGDWEPDPDCRPILAFFREAIKNKDIASKWDADTAYCILLLMLDNYRERILTGVDATLCSQFVQNFVNSLTRNKAKHLIVLPLVRASSDSIIEFNRFLVIPGSLPRQDKIEILAKKTGRSVEKTEELATHTEKSRSPHFYQCTLFCIHVSHQTEWVCRRAREIAMWNVAFLRALFYGFERHKARLRIENMSDTLENSHLLILSHQDWRCTHVPLWFNASCSFPLDWLKKEETQKRLTKLNRLLVFPATLDRLSFRFYRSFRLFSRSVDFIGMREPFEGLGLSSLFLMIAAEGVLLDREAEKRARLSCLLTKFGCPPGIARKHAYKTVDNCYRWRSDFVHSGTDRFPEYDEDLKKGEPQKEIELLRELVARVLLDCPKYIDFAKRRVKKNSGSKKPLGKNATEGEWFKYIEECWELSLIS